MTLSGCQNPFVKGPMKLTAKDAGGTVEMKVGDTLQVMLEGNPTTGYDWEMAPGDEAVLEQLGASTYKADSDLMGSGGQVTLRFKAVAAGQTALQLVYHRPWETDEPPAETFEVTVTVK
jgi:inhibitor of cysteine peptidase